MCIALPMQLLEREGRRGCARAEGTGEETVDLSLVPDAQPGDWLLVFLGSARERISARHAAEVQQLLRWAAAAQDPAGAIPLQAETPNFSLPSALSAEDLAAFSGAPQEPDQ